MVKTFASGAEVPLAARVRTPVGAEVGATLTILQSGDPDVIFTNHAQCPSPSSAPPLCTILSAFLHTPLESS